MSYWTMIFGRGIQIFNTILFAVAYVRHEFDRAIVVLLVAILIELIFMEDMWRSSS